MDCSLYSRVPYSTMPETVQHTVWSTQTPHQHSINTPSTLQNVARHDTRLIQASPRPRRVMEANSGTPTQTQTSLIFDDIPNMSTEWRTY